MLIKDPIPILQKAVKKNKAIAAFNVYNMEMIQAVISGARKEKAPVIIQTTPGTLEYAGSEMIAAMVKKEVEKIF